MTISLIPCGLHLTTSFIHPHLQNNPFVQSMPPLPMEHLCSMGFSYISMLFYVLMVATIISNQRAFHSAYYSLLLSHSAADMFMFIWVEMVMRPRKYNYFGIFSEQMPLYPWLSYSVLMFLRTNTYAAHIPIAYNRFTAFRWPSRQRKIWSRKRTMTWIIGIWIGSAAVTIPFSLWHLDDIFFVELENGIIQMFAGSIYTFDTILILVTVTIVVSVCSVLYIAAWKRSLTTMRKRRRAVAQRRLLLCAIISSLPLLVELIRAIIHGIAHYKNNISVIIFVTEWWFYEMEIIISLQVWVQLFINKTLRHRMWRWLIGMRDTSLCNPFYKVVKCYQNGASHL